VVAQRVSRGLKVGSGQSDLMAGIRTIGQGGQEDEDKDGFVFEAVGPRNDLQSPIQPCPRLVFEPIVPGFS
jgi:hypothetical protein